LRKFTFEPPSVGARHASPLLCVASVRKSYIALSAITLEEEKAVSYLLVGMIIIPSSSERQAQ
ncbi:MAG: hypothetical protein LDL41_15195, partial [Coleofasciculus sp. S288]|nr:hypothetical protein [Coleofasciculus sp. S288]